jgi:large subunit ribosomal protein L3
MNTNFGILGEKLGNTQVFEDDGTVLRVTAIKVGPCMVVDKRTPERDGYAALVLGFGARRQKSMTKPEKGYFEKRGVAPVRMLREFRLPAADVAKFEVGQVLKPSEHFQVGQNVDVTGTSKGHGFTGVMKRWNFAGAGKDTHGTHEYKRHGGAIGTNMTPGRTFPNLKMPGQYGNERATVTNLRIARIFDDEQIIMVRGSVPGARRGLVMLRGTTKRAPARV